MATPQIEFRQPQSAQEGASALGRGAHASQHSTLRRHLSSVLDAIHGSADARCSCDRDKRLAALRNASLHNSSGPLYACCHTCATPGGGAAAEVAAEGACPFCSPLSGKGYPSQGKPYYVDCAQAAGAGSNDTGHGDEHGGGVLASLGADFAQALHGTVDCNRADKIELVVGLLVCMTMAVEFSTGKIEHHIKHNVQAFRMLNRVYKELAILGLVALTLFLVEQNHLFAYDEADKHMFEILHMTLFYTCALYLVSCATLCVVAIGISKRWELYEAEVIEPHKATKEEKSAIQEQKFALRAKFVSIQRKHRGGGWFNPRTFLAYFRALEEARFVDLRSEFIRKHSPLLDATFSMSLYLRRCLNNLMLELVDIHYTLWAIIGICSFLDMLQRSVLENNVFTDVRADQRAQVMATAGLLLFLGHLVGWQKCHSIQWRMLETGLIRFEQADMLYAAVQNMRKDSTDPNHGFVRKAEQALVKAVELGEKVVASPMRMRTSQPGRRAAGSSPAAIHAQRGEQESKYAGVPASNPGGETFRGMLDGSPMLQVEEEQPRRRARGATFALRQTLRPTLSAQEEAAEVAAHLNLFWFGQPTWLFRYMQTLIFLSVVHSAICLQALTDVTDEYGGWLAALLIAGPLIVGLLTVSRNLPTFTIITHVAELTDETTVQHMIVKASLEHKRRELDERLRKQESRKEGYRQDALHKAEEIVGHDEGFFGSALYAFLVSVVSFAMLISTALHSSFMFCDSRKWRDLFIWTQFLCCVAMTTEMFCLLIFRGVRHFTNTRGLLELASVSSVLVGFSQGLLRHGFESNHGLNKRWACLAGLAAAARLLIFSLPGHVKKYSAEELAPTTEEVAAKRLQRVRFQSVHMDGDEDGGAAQALALEALRASLQLEAEVSGRGTDSDSSGDSDGEPVTDEEMQTAMHRRAVTFGKSAPESKRGKSSRSVSDMGKMLGIELATKT